MEIFDYLNNILFVKSKYNPQNMEYFNKYTPYMVNRWLSMFDGETANIINDTTNKTNYLGNDKEMHYKMLLNIVPQKSYSRINYIKKSEKLD